MNPAVHATFFWQGLTQTDLDTLYAQGLGQIELVNEISQYAELAHELYEAAPDHPGVFDYEVCEPFGKWFGEYIIQHHNAPLKDEAKYKLKHLSNLFFNQGEVTMRTIITVEQLHEAFPSAAILAANRHLGNQGIPCPAVWALREHIRMTNGTYTPVNIIGDNPYRFLHVSVDDPEKVSYTKNAEKGAEDIQTRTTLEKYCRKFGLEVPELPSRVPNSCSDCTCAKPSLDELAASVLSARHKFKTLYGQYRTAGAELEAAVAAFQQASDAVVRGQ